MTELEIALEALREIVKLRDRMKLGAYHDKHLSPREAWWRAYSEAEKAIAEIERKRVLAL